jgi:hypothetical protein
MSSNNEDEFGDCLLGDNNLLIIDIDTDHLSNGHPDGTRVSPAAEEPEGTRRKPFSSNDIVKKSTNNSSAADLKSSRIAS